MGVRAQIWWLWWVCCLLLGGCESAAPSSPSFGNGAFGDPCQRTEDCASGLCVRVDASSGVCSVACQTDTGCPASDNWACLGSDRATFDVCACRKLAENEICGDGIDNECNGKADDCRVCGGVAVPDNDPNNCGGCGVVCSTSQVCRGGKCACPETAADACGDVCTTLASDSANCGACGTSCGPERGCQAGKCECSDATRPNYCDGTGCVSFQTDSNHCGDCATSCTLGQTCTGGKCECPNSAAPSFCDGVGCVDRTTDVKHCGACGNACEAGFVCSAGKCACPTGQSECDGKCVDTASSAAHCGACGNACGAAQTCSGSKCGCDAFGFSVCSGACADLSWDENNCGTCGKACAPGETCSSGTCVCPSKVTCNGTCLPEDDAQNCGGCGKACGPTQFCSAGQCLCQGFGLSACGTSCQALGTDEANCGSCGKECPIGQTCNSSSCGCTGAQSYCAAQGACFALGSDPAHCGACDIACKPTEICGLGGCKCAGSNQMYCAAQDACIDVLSDAKNCGTCGKTCNSGEICVSGSCRCGASGQQYCASANACVDILGNTQHCGACDKACNPTQVCQFGGCYCPSATPNYCASANACVSLATDANNCGTCGKQCPAGTHCTSYACVCDTANETLCSATGTCHDLQTDEANCGGCGKACMGTQQCTAGKCLCPTATPGTALRITANTTDDYVPTLAWDGAHVGVGYRTYNGTAANARFALLAADGSMVSDIPLTQYDLTTLPQTVMYGPKVVWNGTEYGVLWVQRTKNEGHYDVAFQRIGANGQPIAPAVDVAGHSDLLADYRFGVGLAWSPSYGGYGVYYLSHQAGSFLVFRRIGATGVSPEPENKSESFYSVEEYYSVAVAPDGTWGTTSRGSGVDLNLFDPDGAHTIPTAHLSTSSSAAQPTMLHDGKTWLTAFIDNNGVGATSIWVNRGATANAPARVLPMSTTVANVDASLAMVNGTLALAYTMSPSAQGRNGPFTIGFQRFGIPATATSALTPIDSAVEILGTATMAKLHDMDLVATGSQSMLAVWADNRWGVNRELYARPIDLHSCP